MRKIGIVGWKVGENSFGVTSTYLEWVTQFGEPVILMPTDGVLDNVDAVVLPGGLDISPQSMGQAPGYHTTVTDIFKQHFFDNKLQHWINAGKAVFGICLGFQQLNVFFGGTLTQNLKYHAQSNGRWEKAHEMVIEHPDVLGIKGKIKVNSHHHQAALGYQLSKELIPLGSSVNEDCGGIDSYNNRIIEAFIHTDLPVAGVQYHPEEWYDEVSFKLFNKILTNVTR